MAETKDTLIIAQRVAAALQAKMKSATTLDAMSDRPMAVLDYAMSPGCRDLPLIAADFFASGDGAASQGELDVVPSVFPLATRWASSDKMLKGMNREFLRLPGGSWTTYITAAIDRLPSTGCDISGQLSATGETIAKAGTRLLMAHATTIDRSFRAKGKLLIAVVERDGKAFIVREPTDSDIAAWAKHLGGQAPPQPPGAVVANSPFGPVVSPTGVDGSKPPAPESVDGNATSARQQEIRKLMEQHLLVRTPQGPTNPIATPAEPKQQR